MADPMYRQIAEDLRRQIESGTIGEDGSDDQPARAVISLGAVPLNKFIYGASRATLGLK